MIQLLSRVQEVAHVPCRKSLQDIISEHQEVLVNNFGNICKEVNLCIPWLFWIPKLHKNPYRYRFVAVARQCSTKQLLVRVNSGLQVVREKLRKYCFTIDKNSGINTFWSINSSLEFLDRIRCLNIRYAWCWHSGQGGGLGILGSCVQIPLGC